MLERADRFADAVQLATLGDPFLDAVSERPLAPFAAQAVNLEATAGRREALARIAGEAGILWFFASDCAVCARQAEVLAQLGRLHGFALLGVSRDGTSLPGMPAMAVRADRGEAARLGVRGLPALFLMRPPSTFLPLAQGALDLDTLAERIIAQAHQAGWIDEGAYAASRPVRRPFEALGPGDLDPELVRDPAALVTALQARLGMEASRDGAR